MARIVTLLFLLGATSILGACETSKGVVRDLTILHIRYHY